MMTKMDGDDTKVQIKSRDVPFWCSFRLGLAFLGFLGFINVYALRVNLSVAIVCMVNHSAIATTSSDNASDVTDTECGDVKSSNESVSTDLNPLGGSLEWDKTTQGTILGSFFWGYLVSQVPAGWLAMKFGGKKVFGISMLFASIATLLTPVLANAHYIALIILRVFLGITTGMSFPTMHTMWGHWAPPLERSKLITFTYAGAQVGLVVTFPVAGFLCKYGFGDGWPSIFYITGAVSCVWSIVWLLLVSDSPTSHKRISDIERDYIVMSLKDSVDEDKKETNVPWRAILTSMPVYAIIIANISSDWGAYTLLTNIPTYINSVLKFDITSNGLVSALPYITFWLIINIGGWLADFVRKRKLLSTAVTRKVFNSFGKIAPAIMLVGLGYIDCSQPAVAIGLLIFAVSLTGAQYSGFLISHVDIAPELAGVLFGLSNSIAAVTGFVSPLIVGVITDSDPTRSGWQTVFYIAAAIYIFGAIFFAVFASGELQPWAQQEESKVDDKMEDLEHMNNGGGEGSRMLTNETDKV